MKNFLGSTSPDGLTAPRRRDVLRSVISGISLATISGLSQAAQFGYPWKLGIITDEVSPDLERVLKSFYPKYALHWAELRNVRLSGKSRYLYKDATIPQVREVRKQLDDANVKVSVLDTGVYKITLPGTKPQETGASDLNPAQGEYSRQLEDLRRAAEVAQILGTDRLRIFTFKRIANPDSVFKRICEDLQQAISVAKQQGVKLLVENEFDCNIATGSETAKLFKALTDRTLMHNWDPGNCFEAGEQPFPKAWNELDHSRISHVHLKDAKGKAWKPIGSGEIDFVGQFKALETMRYSGTMSLETHYKNPQNDPYESSVESMDGLVHVLGEV